MPTNLPPQPPTNQNVANHLPNQRPARRLDLDLTSTNDYRPNATSALQSSTPMAYPVKQKMAWITVIQHLNKAP
jgi:hypothetical protein